MPSSKKLKKIFSPTGKEEVALIVVSIVALVSILGNILFVSWSCFSCRFRLRRLKRSTSDVIEMQNKKEEENEEQKKLLRTREVDIERLVRENADQQMIIREQHKRNEEEIDEQQKMMWQQDREIFRLKEQNKDQNSTLEENLKVLSTLMRLRNMPDPALVFPPPNVPAPAVTNNLLG